MPHNFFLKSGHQILLGNRYWVTQTFSARIYANLFRSWAEFKVCCGQRYQRFQIPLSFCFPFSSWHCGFPFYCSSDKAYAFYSSSSSLLILWNLVDVVVHRLSLSLGPMSQLVLHKCFYSFSRLHLISYFPLPSMAVAFPVSLKPSPWWLYFHLFLIFFFLRWDKKPGTGRGEAEFLSSRWNKISELPSEGFLLLGDWVFVSEKSLIVSHSDYSSTPEPWGDLSQFLTPRIYWGFWRENLQKCRVLPWLQSPGVSQSHSSSDPASRNSVITT